MFFLDPTHRIELEHHLLDGDAEVDRARLAGFVVYFMGFLLGLRAQLADWKVYDPVNVKKERGFLASAQEVAECIEAAEPTWENFSDKQCRTLVNLLFQFQRVPALDWPWDQFRVTYAVVDACFGILADEHGISRWSVRHRARWEWISDQLGVPHTPDAEEAIDRLVGLRNALVHELGWDGYMLGHGYPSASVEPHLHAAAFAERAILGTLGVPAGLVETEWWGRSALQVHGLQL